MKSKLGNFVLLVLGVALTLLGLYVMKFYDVSRLLFAMITVLGIIALEASISNLSKIFVNKKYHERLMRFSSVSHEYLHFFFKLRCLL